MSNKSEVFIFFDNQDNLEVKKNAGWVTNFNRFLTSMVHQIARFELTIRLSHDGKVPTPEELKDTRALIFILSQESVKSPNLVQIIENFQKPTLEIEKKYGIKGASLIFKVLKAPVEQINQPEIIRKYVGYELYDFDIATGAAHEITDFYSRDAERSYWLKLVDLAYDLSEVLLKFQESEMGNVSDGEQMKVYLAETGPELHTQRNIVKRELQRSGIQVLPREPLPSDDMKHFISENVRECNVSIHLFGDRILKKEGGDFIELQNEVASSYLREGNKDKNFLRLIWISPSFNVTTDEQQSYLENLRREVEETGSTEIFQTPFEDFKSNVRQVMTESSSSSEFIVSEDLSDDKPKIYMVYDNADTDNLQKFNHHLSGKGFEVLKPEFSGNLLDIRHRHIHHLVNFDGVIVFFGSVNEFWVRMKLLDILKSPGFGRMKPLRNIAILGKSGKGFDTKAFSNYKLTLIENDDPTSKELEKFLEKIEKS